THSIPSLVLFSQSTPTPHTYTLSLHDALPISSRAPAYSNGMHSRIHGSTPTSWKSFLSSCVSARPAGRRRSPPCLNAMRTPAARSEEHTSELQSRENLVCRLLLEKKKKKAKRH